MRAYVEVTVKAYDANGKNGAATVERDITIGSSIPDVIKVAAERAADVAWETVR